ncbi:MAG: hypothetical protein KDD69_20350, partial [Bdellovibrionales bacterium]|nr:hypothetical protein [Bdellovibrionales bacterium]
WARRYSNEFLPAPEDIEDKFFYTVLQPVQDGLVEQLSEYPFYNCFSDAVRGITRTFKIVRWAEYNAARKRNRKTAIADYTDIVHLKYQRLPGYEHLSQREYSKLMHQKLEERRRKIVAARKAEGKGFLGVQKLLRIVTGSKPQNTKQTGARLQKRPRVLSVCSIRKQNGLSWYFSRFVQYKSASRQYRAGNLEAEFPEGTYKPYVSARAGAPPG